VGLLKTKTRFSFTKRMVDRLKVAFKIVICLSPLAYIKLNGKSRWCYDMAMRVAFLMPCLEQMIRRYGIWLAENEHDICYDVVVTTCPPPPPPPKHIALHVTIPIIYNDGIWWMVWWGPYDIHIHIKLQAMWPNPLDGCIKHELVGVPKQLASKCLHCGWCKGRNK